MVSRAQQEAPMDPQGATVVAVDILHPPVQAVLVPRVVM